jgi:CRP/FNR family transcriptional regulator, cyclic AMP receptor protein
VRVSKGCVTDESASVGGRVNFVQVVVMQESPNELIVSSLSRCRVFQTLGPAEIGRLAMRCCYERFRRGTIIVRNSSDHDTQEQLVVIGRGRVKVSLASPTADGELIVGLLGSGEVFGEPNLFDGEAKVLLAVALADTEVLFVPRRDLLSIIEKSPAVALCLLESVCEKLRLAVEMSLCIRYLDVQARFYRRLQHLGRYDASLDGDGVRIQHALSQRELADSIGVSREALNKLFGEWKRAGLVAYGRGYIVVKDPSGLAQRLPPALRNGGLIEATDGKREDGLLTLERRRRPRL